MSLVVKINSPIYSSLPPASTSALSKLLDKLNVSAPSSADEISDEGSGSGSSFCTAVLTRSSARPMWTAINATKTRRRNSKTPTQMTKFIPGRRKVSCSLADVGSDVTPITARESAETTTIIITLLLNEIRKEESWGKVKLLLVL